MSAAITGVQVGEPVCHPDLPSAVRHRALRSRTRRYTSSGQLVRGTPVRGALRRRRTRRVFRAAIAGWLLLSLANSSLLQTAATILFFVIAFALIVMRIAPGLTRVTDAIMLHRSQGSFIDLASLSEASRVQLLRAQRAVNSVTASALYRDGLLDSDTSREVLAVHNWEIAQLLVDLQRLRGEHARRRGSGIPDTASAAIRDVATSQEDAFAQASAAIEGRVAAVEGYAAQVGEADAAYLAWQHARHLAGLDGECLDLLARATAGDYTTAPVNDLNRVCRCRPGPVPGQSRRDAGGGSGA